MYSIKQKFRFWDTDPLSIAWSSFISASLLETWWLNFQSFNSRPFFIVFIPYNEAKNCYTNHLILKKKLFVSDSNPFSLLEKNNFRPKNTYQTLKKYT